MWLRVTNHEFYLIIRIWMMYWMWQEIQSTANIGSNRGKYLCKMNSKWAVVKIASKFEGLQLSKKCKENCVRHCCKRLNFQWNKTTPFLGAHIITLYHCSKQTCILIDSHNLKFTFVQIWTVCFFLLCTFHWSNCSQQN